MKLESLLSQIEKSDAKFNVRGIRKEHTIICSLESNIPEDIKGFSEKLYEDEGIYANAYCEIIIENNMITNLEFSFLEFQEQISNDITLKQFEEYLLKAIKIKVV